MKKEEYDDLLRRISHLETDRDFLMNEIYRINNDIGNLNQRVNDIEIENRDLKQSMEDLANMLSLRLETFEKVIRGCAATIDEHVNGYHTCLITTGGEKHEGSVSGHRRSSELGDNLEETTLQAGRMETQET